MLALWHLAGTTHANALLKIYINDNKFGDETPSTIPPLLLCGQDGKEKVAVWPSFSAITTPSMREELWEKNIPRVVILEKHFLVKC